MKAHELRDFSVTELKARIKDEQDILTKLRFDRAAVGQLEDVSSLKFHRREIARLKTIISEMERSEQSKDNNSDGTETGTQSA